MKFKYLAVCIVGLLGAVTAWMLLFPGSPNSADHDTATQPSAETGPAPAKRPASVRQPGTDATSTTDQSRQEHIHNQKIADLLDKHLTPAMKQEINAMLNPPGKRYPEQQAEHGGYIDLSGRAASVPVAVIDDDGNLIVTDITSPLPE